MNKVVLLLIVFSTCLLAETKPHQIIEGIPFADRTSQILFNNGTTGNWNTNYFRFSLLWNILKQKDSVLKDKKNKALDYEKKKASYRSVLQERKEEHTWMPHELLAGAIQKMDGDIVKGYMLLWDLVHESDALLLKKATEITGEAAEFQGASGTVSLRDKAAKERTVKVKSVRGDEKKAWEALLGGMILRSQVRGRFNFSPAAIFFRNRFIRGLLSFYEDSEKHEKLVDAGMATHERFESLVQDFEPNKSSISKLSNEPASYFLKDKPEIFSTNYALRAGEKAHDWVARFDGVRCRRSFLKTATKVGALVGLGSGATLFGVYLTEDEPIKGWDLFKPLEPGSVTSGKYDVSKKDAPLISEVALQDEFKMWVSGVAHSVRKEIDDAKLKRALNRFVHDNPIPAKTALVSTRHLPENVPGTPQELQKLIEKDSSTYEPLLYAWTVVELYNNMEKYNDKRFDFLFNEMKKRVEEKGTKE